MDSHFEKLIDDILLLDLEVSPEGKVLKIGACLGEAEFFRSGNGARDFQDFSRFAEAARLVAGHNILAHDLGVLRQHRPDLPLLKLPAIDTLLLSPICFPQNPYHRLVKDYKIVSESLNDPVADAKLSGLLLQDEIAALRALSKCEPLLFSLLGYLLTLSNNSFGRGNRVLFQHLRTPSVSKADALEIARTLLPKWGCSSFPLTEASFEPAAGLALCYTLSWLRVAGANSVVPFWVRKEYPKVLDMVRALREVPCGRPICAYCSEHHDAQKELKRFFGFDGFRDTPRNSTGGSLQRDIIEAGMRNESMLAILPTGGGKSICFQLPALVRNFRRGSLTVVISPLQALMKDQVDGLARRTGTPFAAALFGLLPPPERGDVLRRIAFGDIAILYVSPEQLRNKSFRNAISQREIGCWVFDEAHCLSKWGHDFRSDYLYAGRFIREFAEEQGTKIPAIACFTATAKEDVKKEIVEFFKSETGQDLKLFEGGVKRSNLEFEVQKVSKPEKLERVHDLLQDQFPRRNGGCAIVFRATRKLSEMTAEFLRAKGWQAAFFHAGLSPSEKKDIQDRFLNDEIQVICATNAFGMGIDKNDVRLVIHGDTPGSLENYLQEAGRAGRDQEASRCVLLFDDSDVEWQFRMNAFSEISHRDIVQVLKTLRKSRKRKAELVITPGEILRDEGFDADLGDQQQTAETKVRTAIYWLERARFLDRDENVNQVFQARLLVKSLAEATPILESLNLTLNEKSLWVAILQEIINTPPDKSITVDQLALLPEFGSVLKPFDGQNTGQKLALAPLAHDFVSGKVLRILRAMEQARLLKRDTLLSALVHYKIANHSGKRLEKTLAADRKLVDLLATMEPDPEGWMPLSVPLVNQRLLDEGVESSPELIRLLLKSLEQDGRGFAGMQSSLDTRYAGRDLLRVKVNRRWQLISELAEKRRRVAEVILSVLLGKVPPGTKPCSDLLVSFSFEELSDALNKDILLRSEVALKDSEAALERGLMYLHEQRVITLQQGLAIFRSAMTIRFKRDAHGEKYKKSDYQPLGHYYKERVFQVHVMDEYARSGQTQISAVQGLVQDYFSLDKEDFVRRYFAGKKELLNYATTARSFHEIVTRLGNPAQIRIVTAAQASNMLVLAGPGSGKTKVVVHRCAYLLGVERVRPQNILICCFNRQTAVELRRRLHSLVGADARGVTITTYHSLSMRLLGYSFAGTNRPGNLDLQNLITKATALLKGEAAVPGMEPDEVRDRLLAGFQHVLVDEYQDIDQEQYDLISAIAGRKEKDEDHKLSIMAVGDDDQNIYAFRGANVEFIRRFQEDYRADIHCLVENYRSTQHIIAASNQVINGNQDRMKKEHPIRINGSRKFDPPSGSFGAKDPLTSGRVQLIDLSNSWDQGHAVIAELRRLKELGVTDWSSIAVLARTHRDLAQVRTLAERENIPFQWWADRDQIPRLHHIREVADYLKWLGEIKNQSLRASELMARSASFLTDQAQNPWTAFLAAALEDWKAESLDAESPLDTVREFFWSYCAEARRNVSFGRGVHLSTIHAAKGTEHDHVLLLGNWALSGDSLTDEELRRLFYVGMTRAKRSLSVVLNRNFGRTPVESLGTTVVVQPFAHNEGPEPEINYTLLGPEHLHLGWPAYFPANDPTHNSIKALTPGERVYLELARNRVVIFNSAQARVGCLSRKGTEAWAQRLGDIREAQVFAMLQRRADQESDPAKRNDSLVDRWEVPMIEITIAGPRRYSNYPSNSTLQAASLLG